MTPKRLREVNPVGAPGPGADPFNSGLELAQCQGHFNSGGVVGLQFSAFKTNLLHLSRQAVGLFAWYPHIRLRSRFTDYGDDPFLALNPPFDVGIAGTTFRGDEGV